MLGTKKGKLQTKARHKHAPHMKEGQWQTHIEIASLFIESKQGEIQQWRREKPRVEIELIANEGHNPKH